MVGVVVVVVDPGGGGGGGSRVAIDVGGRVVIGGGRVTVDAGGGDRVAIDVGCGCVDSDGCRCRHHW